MRLDVVELRAAVIAVAPLFSRCRPTDTIPATADAMDFMRPPASRDALI